jgi:hypothetical protein
MWILSFLPDSFLLYVINTTLLVGAIGSFLTFFALHRLLRWFPAISPYYFILQIISAVLLVAGIYLKGGYGVEMEWRSKVKEFEDKIKIAEEKSAKTNTVIQTKIVEKVKVVKDTQYVIQEKIKEVEKLIDKECKVAPEAIDLHNAAARNVKPGDTK